VEHALPKRDRLWNSIFGRRRRGGKKALDAPVKKYSGWDDPAGPERLQAGICIMRIVIDSMTGKQSPALPKS